MNIDQKIYEKNKIIEESKQIENLISKSINLKKSKFYDLEIVVSENIGIYIETRSCKLENISFTNNHIIKVNLFNNGFQGTSYSNIPSIKSIINAIDNAYEISKYSSQDYCLGISDRNLLAYKTEDLDLFHPIDFNMNLMKSILYKSEKEIKDHNVDFIKNDRGYLIVKFNIFAFGNSYNMIKSYISSYYEIACSAIVNNKDESMNSIYAYNVNCKFENLKKPEIIGKECIEKAILFRNPKKIKSTEMPVIFSTDVVHSIFYHLAESISGINVYRKITFLKNYLNKPILPEWLSIYELPHIHMGLASCPFDNEGVKTKDRIIVENGVLKTWLMDNYSSRKLNMKSTGHAGNKIYNWKVIINKKIMNFNQLVKQMDCGLIVNELMGSGFNIINGDYSRGVSCGFKVRDGKIIHPVHEITIASNLKYMMKNIINISNDKNINSNVDCGSILISSMKVAGN